MIETPVQPLSWRSVAVILLYGGTLLAVNLGGAGRALTYHEVVFAQPAREMLETGDWVIPRMLGVPDTHKPPLTSWLIALAIHFLGAAEWAVRLPSVLAALATAVWLGYVAARWFGDRVGCLTGLIHLTMYYVLQFGRLAEADIFLVLFVALAMGIFMIANVTNCVAGAESSKPRHSLDRRGFEDSAPATPDRWLPVVFYFACGLAFMTKSLIGLAFIGSACGLFAIWRRERRVWQFLLNPLGLGLFAICLFAWPLAAYLTYPQFLDDQINHHLGRFQGVWGEDEPIYCYLYDIPRCALPWTPLALWGIVVGWRHGWLRGPLGWFTLCWIVPGTALLTMSQWRHYHYVAPLMPPLALLAAVGLVDCLERRRQNASSSWWRLPLVASVGLAAVIAVVAQLPNLRGRQPILVFMAITTVAFWLYAWLEQRRQQLAQFVTIFGALWLLAAGTFHFVIPHYDLYSQLAQFAERINRLTPAEAPLHMVDLKEDQLTWYLRQPLVRIDDLETFAQSKVAQRHPFYLLAPQSALDVIAKQVDLQIIERSPVAPRRIESLRVSFARISRPGEMAVTTPSCREFFAGAEPDEASSR